jgi:hypothetical protein
MLVTTKGSGKKARSMVVYEDGSPVVNQGIDPSGYETDAKAWDAILKAQK